MRTWIYVWIGGEAVGFVGDEASGFVPFGALFWREDDREGRTHRIRCEAFDAAKTDTIEEAKARLLEWISIAGVYEAVPIVSGRRPVVPRSTTGAWTRERVSDVVRSVLAAHGADPEDIAGDLPTEMLWATARGGLTLRLGMEWIPILPSTEEEAIRSAVRAWCASVKAAWGRGVPFATNILPRTHASWMASREGGKGR